MSILDKVRPTLDPQVWDLTAEDNPTLHPQVADQIRDTLQGWLDSHGLPMAKGIYFIGSSATRQYRATSDIDITVVLDLELDQIKEAVQFLGEINGQEFVGKHPINYYLRSGEMPLEFADAVYDVEGRTWLKEHDPETGSAWENRSVIDQAIGWAKHIDLDKGALARNVIEYQIIQEMLHEVSDDEKNELEQALQDALHDINLDIEHMVADYDEIREDRRRAFESDLEEQGEPVGPAYMSKNLLPGNVVYKYLERYRYLQLLQELRKLDDVDSQEAEFVGMLVGAQMDTDEFEMLSEFDPFADLEQMSDVGFYPESGAMLWIYGPQGFQTAPVVNPDDPEGHGRIHMEVWGFDVDHENWRGRYDPNTGEVSILPPHRLWAREPKVPRPIRRNLVEEFGVDESRFKCTNCRLAQKKVTAKFTTLGSLVCEHCKDVLYPQEMGREPRHIYEIGQLWACGCGKSRVWCNSLRSPGEFVASLEGGEPYRAGVCFDRYCGHCGGYVHILKNGIPDPLDRGRNVERMGCTKCEQNQNIAIAFHLETGEGEYDHVLDWFADRINILKQFIGKEDPGSTQQMYQMMEWEAQQREAQRKFPSDPEHTGESPKPSRLWKQIIKEREEADLFESPNNESDKPSGHVEPWNDLEDEEWVDILKRKQEGD